MAKKELKIIFMLIADRLLTQEGGTTYKQIAYEFERERPELMDKDDQDMPKLSYKSYYNSLKKAMNEIAAALKAKGLDFRHPAGSRSYAYPIGIESPLSDKKNEQKRMRLKQLLRLVQQSKGLFPDEWLVKFKYEFDSIQEERQPERGHIIEFSGNSLLQNLNVLPIIYDAIEKQQVVSFDYKARFLRDIKVVLHPYYLKEFNQRWFVLGRSEENSEKTYETSVYSLDRIVPPIVSKDTQFMPATIDYDSLFRHVIGVTIPKKREIYHIEIKTLDAYTHNRIVSKPLHDSQKEIHPFMEEQSCEGRLSIDVIPNRELFGLLLSFGKHIRITSPAEIVNQMAKEINEMNNLYQ